MAEYAASRWRLRHPAEIRERYGYRPFSDPSVQFRLNRWLYALCWTESDRPELLLEMHARTGFAGEFTHASERGARASDLSTSICAVLLVEACNTGFEPLIRLDTPALRRSRLSWVRQNYVRAETLTRATAALVAAQAAIPLAPAWGGGAALNQLRAEGYDVRDEDVARLSPLGFEHINMLGRYAFTLPDTVARGELRPLRDPASAGDESDEPTLTWLLRSVAPRTPFPGVGYCERCDGCFSDQIRTRRHRESGSLVAGAAADATPG